MVFLSESDLDSLSENEAKEALKYSNLCKANMEVIRVLEEQVKRLAGELCKSSINSSYSVNLNSINSKPRRLDLPLKRGRKIQSVCHYFLKASILLKLKK